MSSCSWVKVRSFGGANSVTGSCHLITATIDGYDYKYLVDCGLFQGHIARKHYELQFNIREIAREISGVFVTHAHIDHIGRIPAITKWGYGGSIYATAPVCELAKPVLEDSAKIQFEEYEFNLKRELEKADKGEVVKEVELLYELDDVYEALTQFKAVERNEEIIINPYLTAVFYESGHAFGSASVKLIFNNGEETYTLLFSGDLGNQANPILKNADIPYITGVDAVFMETTYAGRFHGSQEENWNDIRTAIANTLLNGGRVILPAFAVGRTQEMLYILFKDMLENDDWVSDVLRSTKIYVDSPLAISATKVFKVFPEEFADVVKGYLSQKRNNPFDFSNLQFVHEKEDSISLCASDEPCIILSAAGMCDAGRVVYHLRDNLDKSEATVIFTGYQAEGTLGRRLLDGEEYVSVAKKQCKVNSQLLEMNTLSAHADQNGLIEWLNNIEPGYMLFLIHGEREKQEEFKELVEKFDIFSTVECLDLNVEYELGNNGFIKNVEEIVICPQKPKKKQRSFKMRDLRYIAYLTDHLEQVKDDESCKLLSSKIKSEIKRYKFNVRRRNLFKKAGAKK